MVAIIGLATAFFAATIGLAQNDIKKVFAYSTVSQLGYMFLGLGCGAFSAGIFHLMTHAFFKALLFLGAGSVIHALSGEQDLRNMGGLRKKIPWTFCDHDVRRRWPSPACRRSPGFFSKDAILLAAHHHAPWMYWVGVVTAGMTAFYVFRALFLTFFGEYRGEAHPHESPAVDDGCRWRCWPCFRSRAATVRRSATTWRPMFPLAEEAHDFTLVAISVAAGLAGIALAWLMYVRAARHGRMRWRGRSAALYTLVYNKYFVDEIYDAAVVKPAGRRARARCSGRAWTRA